MLLKCPNHPDVEAESKCNGCGRYFCSKCVIETKGMHYCANCIPKLTVNGRMPPEREVRQEAALKPLAIIVGGLVGFGILQGLSLAFASAIVGAILAGSLGAGLAIAIGLLAASGFLGGGLAGGIGRERPLANGACAGLVIAAVLLIIGAASGAFAGLPGLAIILTIAVYAAIASICGGIGGLVGGRLRARIG